MSSSHCSGCDGDGGCRSRRADGPDAAAEELGSLSVGRRLCRKCGEAEEVYDRLCRTCLRASIFGKFKHAVTSNAMISPLDNVLVAFSGGAASRTALEFVHEMQLKAQKSWDASKDQSLPVFRVGVAFVDETAVSFVSPEEIKEVIEHIRVVVSSLAAPMKQLYVVPIESIWSADAADAKSRLKKLLDAVNDVTGREDIVLHLRLLCLQKIALENGFSKLLLGSSTMEIACHILSATVKGQGYSLPADIQYVDARWEVPTVFPLRDCSAQELKMLCHVDGLKTQQLRNSSHGGINELISSFVTRLQEENPSRARTIVRTAEKLTPFSFNKIENVCSDMLPSRVRRKFQFTKAGGPEIPEILCPLCGSPICDVDLESQRSASLKFQEVWDLYTSTCCQSCNCQILPKDASKFKDFYGLLPPQITLRCQHVNGSDNFQLRNAAEYTTYSASYAVSEGGGSKYAQTGL